MDPFKQSNFKCTYLKFQFVNHFTLGDGEQKISEITSNGSNAAVLG